MYTSQPTHFPHMRGLRLVGWGLRAFIQGLTWLGLHLGPRALLTVLLPPTEPPHSQHILIPSSSSPSEGLDQIPNNVAHATEGKMARVCRKGKRRSKARKKRRKRSPKSLAPAQVALARPLPRTPEQESCTVPVQVRPCPLYPPPPGPFFLGPSLIS